MNPAPSSIHHEIIVELDIRDPECSIAYSGPLPRGYFRMLHTEVGQPSQAGIMA